MVVGGGGGEAGDASQRKSRVVEMMEATTAAFSDMPFQWDTDVKVKASAFLNDKKDPPYFRNVLEGGGGKEILIYTPVVAVVARGGTRAR